MTNKRQVEISLIPIKRLLCRYRSGVQETHLKHERSHIIFFSDVFITYNGIMLGGINEKTTSFSAALRGEM